MSIARIRIIARLELTQRLRSAGWYVLLGVYAFVLLVITALSFLVFRGFMAEAGAGVYSVVVNIVLLLVVLVSPTLSGNAINGDRDSATLAPIQVTRATTGDVMLGKLVAAVATGGLFLVVAIPFLLLTMVTGGVSIPVLLVSLLVLAAEIIIIAAIGVGMSGLIARPLFSVAASYLIVAALVIGTLIIFALGTAALRTEQTYQQRPWSMAGEPICDEWEEYVYEVPRPDFVWPVLAANPFVVLADATPSRFGAYGEPVDLFGGIKVMVRSAQLPPQESRWDPCAPYVEEERLTSEEIVAQTVPSWFAGLGLQAILAGALFAGAWSRTRTPAKRLPPGTRIA